MKINGRTDSMENENSIWHNAGDIGKIQELEKKVAQLTCKCQSLEDKLRIRESQIKRMISESIQNPETD